MDWDTLKLNFSKAYGTPVDIIDYQSVIEALKLCVCGYSNEKIEKYLEYDRGVVGEILTEYLQFPGFELDLDFNPLMVYNRTYDFEEFVDESKLFTILDINYQELYRILNKYNFIENRLKEYYE